MPPRSSLYGREADLARLGRLLHSAPLVTLTGPGGVGKTRLAIEFARRAGDAGEHVCWVDLSDLHDPSLVTARLATALRTPLVTRPGQHVLLVLDNCEHLVDALVAELDALPATWVVGDDLRVVVTSQRPLGADGEAILDLPALATPPTEVVDPEAIIGYPSVRLFLDRAARACAAPANDPDSLHEVARLCRGLDGLPFAIELAAARSRTLGLDRILTGLADGSEILGGGLRSTGRRHPTMQAALAWSHGLLQRDDQIVLRRLAVFAGGAAFDDLAAVAGAGLRPSRIADAVDNLVRGSLLTVEAGPTGPRFRSGDLVKRFAMRQLVRSGEAADTAARHARHFAGIAGELGSHTDGAVWSQTLSRFVAEIDNLHLALQTLTENGSLTAAARCIWDTQHFWGLTRPAAADRSVTRVLDTPTLAAEDRVWLLVARATIRMDAGQLVAAAGDTALARTALDDSTNPIVAARARLYDAALRAVVDPEVSEDELPSQTAACRQVGDTYGEAFGSVWRGACLAVFRGALTRGLTELEQALGFPDLHRYPHLAAWGHCFVAEILAERGLVGEALAAADEAERRLAGAGERGASSGWVPSAMIHLVRGYTSVLQGEVPLDATDLVRASRSSAARGHVFSAYQYQLLEVLHRLGDGSLAVDDPALEALRELAAQAGGWFSTNASLVAALAALERGELDGCRGWLARIDPDTLAVPMFAARSSMIAATLALRLGDEKAGEKAAFDGLAVAVEEGLTMEGIQLLEVLVQTAGTDARGTDSVRVAAAAGSLRAAHRLRFGPPAHVRALEQAVDRLRTQLGPAAFEAAWQDGLRLGLAGAAEVARRGRGHRRHRGFGWDSLSEMEREVAALVARGLTNRQVADELLISAETVKTHVRHIFAKLGVGNRVQIATIALGRGVGRPPRTGHREEDRLLVRPRPAGDG